ncbi:MAG TPA: prolyl oligopeptidase family serine peptidase, partial [Gemmatimonadaceae bacterium]
MRSSRLVTHLTLVVLLLAPPATLPAQAVASSARDATGTGKALRTLSLDDYGSWNRITSVAISPDGRWATYAYRPNDGDVTLYIKELDGDRGWSTSIGAPAGGGGRGGGEGTPQFSEDSRWVAYLVNPPSPPPGRSGRGGGRGGSGGTSAPTRKLELLDLRSGEKFVVPNAASFRFSKDARWFAARLNRAGNDTSVNSGDLVLRDLTNGTTRNIGNVNLYAFDESGRFLAYTVDARDRLGNGVYLIDLSTGLTRALNSADAEYDQLAWSDEGTSVAVLRGQKQPSKRQRDNVVLAWMRLGRPDSASFEYDPARDPGFPAGMVVSEFASLRWTDDGARIFLGVKEQEEEPEESRDGEPRANVDVWHWKDPEPQSVQMRRLNQERRATYFAVLDVATRRVRQIADSAMRTVTPSPDGKWGIGRLDAPYRIRNSWGWNTADYYRVNLVTGERTPIQSELNRTMGVSPDSRWFLYLKDKHVYAYELATGRTVQVDARAGRSFVNEQDDHAAEKPIYGVAGWSADGKSVVLNHRYDLWQLPLDRSQPVNLTRGVGDREEIRFRIAPFRPGAGDDDEDDDDADRIDLTKPLVLSAYGDFTKKSGYWRLTPGRAPEPLIWADKQIGGVVKADKADRLLFTQQTFQEFPDYWVTTTAFDAPRKVTDANPQLAEYAWGSKVLIDYHNSKGQRLQATLTLPAGYEPGKRYPMLVYFYEIMSTTHHQFSMPVYDDRPHISTYASDGYLVLQPDVVYEIGKPGSSALDCVTAAVKRVIELGYADPERIGLQGHSWGGYQSSFIVTQTDMFAAVV